MKNPKTYNIGKSDYSTHKIQPYDIWEEYNLNPWEADIIKRVLRKKEGESKVLDLEKIKHICDYLIFNVTTEKGIYFSENGITVNATESTKVGFKQILNGKEYEVVSREMLIEKIKNNEDVTTCVTSKITNMDRMFQGAENFNQNISSWDVSNVKYTTGMFEETRNFNQDLSSWNTANVKDMAGMFQGAINFNQDLTSWDTSNVVNMEWMFSGAKNFNQDISSWNTSNVKNMCCMFFLAKNFNQDISSWNTSNVKNMCCMFFLAKNFNQDISSWDVSNVTEMEEVFKKSGISEINKPKFK